MTLDLEQAARHFLDLATRLSMEPVLRLDPTLDAMLDFYRNARVDGCAVDDDADMQLLQWGAGPQSLLMEPTDLRVTTGASRYTQEPRNYLNLTRQLRPDPEAAALQLSLRLVYDPAKGDEDSSNLWIASPFEVHERLLEFEAEPFVQLHRDLAAQRIIATVEETL